MLKKNPNTKEMYVDGIVTSFVNGIPKMMKKRFCVRYTNDKNGKSLSITDEKSGVMFHIPFAEVLKEIKKKEAENEIRS